jgi:hypothetical protein
MDFEKERSLRLRQHPRSLWQFAPDDRDPPVLSGQEPLGKLAAVGGHGVRPLRPELGVHDCCASGRRNDCAGPDLVTDITTRAFQVASGGPLGTRMRVRVVVYAWRLAVNLAVRYSPRWSGPEIAPFASVPAKMNVIELPGR